MERYRVYLDANVFIEMWENGHSDDGRRIWDLITHGIQQRWQLVSSELTRAEVLVKPLSRARISGDASLAQTYSDNVQDKLSFQRIVPISRDILDTAARVRSKNAALKLPDAIHLATAVAERCSVFLSNDERLVKAIQKAQVSDGYPTAITFAGITGLIGAA